MVFFCFLERKKAACEKPLNTCWSYLFECRKMKMRAKSNLQTRILRKLHTYNVQPPSPIGITCLGSCVCGIFSLDFDYLLRVAQLPWYLTACYALCNCQSNCFTHNLTIYLQLKLYVMQIALSRHNRDFFRLIQKISTWRENKRVCGLKTAHEYTDVRR
jgi:hypothetical protein